VWFVGIDPSITSTGFVILDEEGAVVHAEAIRMPSKWGKSPVWLVARNQRTVILSHIARSPSAVFSVAMEQPLLRGNGALERAGLFGVLVEALGGVLAVAPSLLKKFATGDPFAKKDAIRLRVFKRWSFEHESNDAVDAFVLAHMARAVHAFCADHGRLEEYLKAEVDVVERLVLPRGGHRAQGRTGRVPNLSPEKRDEPM